MFGVFDFNVEVDFAPTAAFGEGGKIGDGGVVFGNDAEQFGHCGGFVFQRDFNAHGHGFVFDDVFVPGNVQPTFGFVGELFQNGAILGMNGNTFAGVDDTDDFVTRDGVAAFGKVKGNTRD